MEALIGFAVGYWVGTRDGREGLQRALDALNDIAKSEEFRGLMTQGLSIGGSMLSKGLQQASGLSFAQGAIGIVAERAGKILGGGLRAA